MKGRRLSTTENRSTRGKLSAYYRALVQRIQAANMAAPLNRTVETIGVMSPARGAGVSTVAFNIAVAAARADMGPVRAGRCGYHQSGGPKA